jgi:bifunctional N-acetylglucosamine-1-phosphate-uridyltransferase/glucosamine-1-phosphate-acetyltransferase GlmU-like protein
MNRLYITLLAGGIGKRMQSDLPKVLHKVKGEVMIIRLLKQVIQLNPDKILIVVGKFRDMIKNEINKYFIEHNDSSYGIPNNIGRTPHRALHFSEKNLGKSESQNNLETFFLNNKIVYINQEHPLGTGDAVKCTLDEFNGESVINIILNGDVPLLQYQTIKEIYDYFLSQYSKFLITSINLSNPTGNGRIIIDTNHNFKEIVEEKDCLPEQKNITLVNCGIYICSSDILIKYIPLIKNNNAQSEYYLTDLVKVYKDATNQKIDLFVLTPEKEIEIYNINTKEQLQFIENSNQN